MMLLEFFFLVIVFSQSHRWVC